jgi:hypothetical protein
MITMATTLVVKITALIAAAITLVTLVSALAHTGP